MSPIACPNREELVAYVLGNLPEELLETITNHLEGCTTCESTVSAMDEMSDSFISELRMPAGDELFLKEAQFQQGAALVAAIGRDPSRVSAGNAGEPAAEEDLGVIGQYKLLAMLGEGGMGAVYMARHIHLNRIVALKILPAARLRDPQAVLRFYREMKAVGCLDHPNIVRASDAGPADGTHILVMELIDGLDLSRLVRRIGPLPLADACELVRQAAVGLQHAHEQGLVHRDVKPANLMVTSDEVVKVLDLGLALLGDIRNDDELTSTGQFMGTLDYMAPEQCDDSHEVDIRADIYSLGATLYRLLSGQAPFADEKCETPVKKIAALTTKPIPAIQDYRPDISAELAAAIERMLARNPADRFAEPKEVADALGPFASGSNLGALLARAKSEPATPVGTESFGASTFKHLSSALVDTDPSKAASLPAPAQASPPRRRLFGLSWPLSIFGMTVSTRTVAALLLLLAGSLGFYQIMIRIKHPDGGETVIKAPEGSEITVDPTGKVEIAVAPLPDVSVTWDLYKLALQETYGQMLSSELQYGKAETQLRRVFEARRRAQGDEHPDTLSTMNELANSLRLQNTPAKLDEAEPLFRRLLEIRRRVLGNEHSETLGTLEGLAENLFQAGSISDVTSDLDESEKLFRQVIEVRSRVQGEKHPQTLIVMSRLADLVRCSRNSDRWPESEKLFHEVLKTQRQVQGKDHLDTLATERNLAHLLLATGGLDEAERLFQRQLDLFRGMHGENHILTLGVKEGIALVLHAKGKLDEAQEMFQHVFDIRIKSLGVTSHYTLYTAQLLAEVLNASGKPDEAGKLYLRLLDDLHRQPEIDMTQLFGWITSQSQLLRHQGKLQEAENLMRAAMEPNLSKTEDELSAAQRPKSDRVEGIAQKYIDLLDQQREKDGQENSQTIALGLSIADALAVQWKDNSAAALYRRVLDAQQAVFGEESTEWLRTAHSLATVLRRMGRLDEAHTLAVKVTALQRDLLGPDHPLTLDTEEVVAQVMLSRARPQEAEALFRELLEKRRRVQGDDHIATWNTRGRIAAALIWGGKLAEAEQLFREIVQHHSDEMGDNDIFTLKAVGGLGDTLRRRHKWDEAEVLLRPHLKRCREVLGDDHITTLGAMAALAWALTYEGQSNEKLDEAEQLFRKALKAYVQLVGPFHIDTQYVVQRFSELLLLRSPDNWEQIEDLHRMLLDETASGTKLEAQESISRSLLEIERKNHGDVDPRTLAAMFQLAELLRTEEVGKLDEAEALLRELLVTRRRSLGNQHRDTLTAAEHLAWVLIDLGKIAEASSLLAEVVDVRRNVNGQDHPATLGALRSQAGAMRAAGKLDEAETLLRKVVDSQHRIIGSDHEDTLYTGTLLGGLLHERDKLDEAEILFRQFLEAQSRLRRQQNPRTLDAMEGLAWVLRDKGETNEAQALAERALDARRRAQGNDHPRTLATMEGLAWLHRNKGDFDKAASLFRELLNIRIRTLGAEHHDTQTTRSDLAGVLQQQGKLKEAEVLLREVLGTRDVGPGAHEPTQPTKEQ